MGLVVGKRLCRIRHRCGGLVLSESPEKQTLAYLPNDLRNRRNLLLLKWSGLLREIDQKCLKRPRLRCRRLRVYSTDPRRPQGDLFGRD